MSLMTLSGRKILHLSTDELWDTLTGDFNIQFDDGLLKACEGTTNYSSYVWDIIREFPDMPFLKKYHLNSILGDKGDKFVSVSATTKLFQNVVWDVYDWVLYKIDPRDETSRNLVMNPANASRDPSLFKEYLAKRIWEVLNKMYNDLIVRCQPWIIGISIEDLIEVVMYPPLKEKLIQGELLPFQLSIDEIYSTAKEVLYHDPNMSHNPLSRLVKSGVINEHQLYQCIGVRGFIADIDSEVFPLPIMRNLTNGIRKSYDSQIESRSAAKSLAFSEEPLEQSEYFSRRQQLISQTLRRLHEKDCGAPASMSWQIDESDLEHLEGKNYYDDEGKLRYIKSSDKHLVGKTVNMRTLFGCRDLDHAGVCTTCFGQLSLSVFKDATLGQDTAVSMLSDIGQRVLSVKHLDGSSVVDSMNLDQTSRVFLRVDKDGSSYILSPDLKNAVKIELIFDPFTVPGFTDIRTCKNISELFLPRVSRMNEFGIRVTYNNKVLEDTLLVGLEKRKASLSFDVITLIRERGWTVNDKGNYVVDITGIDIKSKIFTVPLRHFNMGDQAKAIAALLESKADFVKERDEETPINEFIADLYETVNSRLSVNFAVLEAITYSIMIVSAKNEDYSLPKPWTDHGLGVKGRIFRRRSASAEMAFEDQQGAILDPIRYNYTNTMDHQMDVFIDPQAVVNREAELKRKKSLR